MAAACSRGGGVKVDDVSTIMIKSLKKRTAAARSEATVELVVCSGAGDEAAACSRVEIEDGRWRRHGGF
jgi:hypothetical protein